MQKYGLPPWPALDARPPPRPEDGRDQGPGGEPRRPVASPQSPAAGRSRPCLDLPAGGREDGQAPPGTRRESARHPHDPRRGRRVPGLLRPTPDLRGHRRRSPGPRPASHPERRRRGRPLDPQDVENPRAPADRRGGRGGAEAPRRVPGPRRRGGADRPAPAIRSPGTVHDPAAVQEAADAAAIETRLVSDAVVRNPGIEELMRTAESARGTVVLVSRHHEAGKKLEALGGIAALLRFAIK